MLPDRPDNYQKLLNQISARFREGQSAAARAVNVQLLETYWSIGQYIVEYEQGGEAKAQYGRNLMETLAKDLSQLHGKGFSLSNLKRIRQFFLQYPKSATVSRQLSWSHYVELLKIDDGLERSFYEKQSILENWSVRELKRQKKASLFLRLASSRDKAGILELAKSGQQLQKAEGLIREPYIASSAPLDNKIRN